MGKFGSRLKQIMVQQLPFISKPSDGLDYQADGQQLSQLPSDVSRKSTYIRSPRRTSKSTLNSALRSANNWFEVCFQRRDHQEAQEAISRIQRTCKYFW